ncbi:MAG: 3-deoxy-D-manno-octulosonic acid transferase [Pseudomonadota bacterium]
MNALFLGLYSALTWLGQPLLRRKLVRRSRQEPGYGEAAEERFGYYSQPAESTSELVWLHAVSLGETRTAAVLLKALRARYPGLRILLTHGTATGRAEGAGLLQPGDVQVWQPWDSKGAVMRFFSHFKPRLGLLMETEVWPNMVAVAKAQAVSLVLVNGRLSDKSLRQALGIPMLSYPAYGALTAVYAQTDDDARRYRQLGANVEGVLGNLKFDATPDENQQAIGRDWRRASGQSVVMFASSREGEESVFFEQIVALKQEKQTTSLPRFLVVPRHPQRFDEVQALAESQGLNVSRRSGWTAGPADDEGAQGADVWLGDSLGEMALYYAMSDVALLGGSFEALGGQNLIEAAACGCPVVMGPHTFNFTEAADIAQASGAARRVTDLPEGVRSALALVARPNTHHAAVLASLAFAAGNRGATEKTLAALKPFLARI